MECLALRLSKKLTKYQSRLMSNKVTYYRDFQQKKGGLFIGFALNIVERDYHFPFLISVYR